MASINTGGSVHLHPAVASTAQPAAGGSKDAPRPVASAKGPQESAVTTLAHKKTASTRRSLLFGTDPLSHTDTGPAPKVVVGVADQGIGLVGGQLHVWRPQDSAWAATGVTDIASIKLGANNDQVWALSTGGDLRQVDADGTPQAAGQFRLPAGARDFAVSPTASAVTYITQGGAVQRQTAGAAAQPLPLPPDLGGAPGSLAHTNNGDLYLASVAGDVWRRPARPAPSAAAGSTPAWSRVGLPVHGGAPRQMGQLQVLRDGHLGAEDSNGALCKYDPLKNTWSETTLHSGGDHRQAFERLPAGSGWNKIGLNAAPLSFFSLGLPSSTPQVAGHGDVAALQNTLRDAMGQLSRRALNGTPALATLTPEAQGAVRALLAGSADGAAERTEGVDAAAGHALTVLEQRLAQLPRSQDTAKVNNPDHNALQAVYNFRTRVLNLTRTSTPPDPVTSRLADLLRQRVCLPVNEPASMIAMGKMVVDHALVKQALDAAQPSHGAQQNAAPPAAPVGDDAAAMVSTLFHAGMMDRDQFQRINAVSASVNAGITGMNAGLARTLHPVAGAAAETSAIGAQFADLVCNLRPGKESVVLNFSHSKGVDLEGLWMFFNLNSKTTGQSGPHVLSANKLPILTPLATGSHGATLTVETSRTEHGVQVVLSDSNASSASLGVRAQLRYGGVWEKANGLVTLLAVAGVEGAIIPGASMSDQRGVAMQFTQNDEGKVQQVIADLYSGEVSLTDLLKRADMVTNARGDSFNINAEGYVHVFGALRANYGKQSDKLAPGTLLAASNLVVPMLDQLSGKVSYDSASEVSSDQRGNTRHKRQAGVTGSLDFNHISVVDISTWFSVPLGKDASTQIQWKVPLLLTVLNHNLWSNQIAPRDATVLLAANGALTGASVTLATREATLRTAAADQPLTAALFPQLSALLAQQPGLQRFVDRLNANPAWRPAVTLELTPAALAHVHTRIAALAGSGAPPARARAEVVDLVNRSMSEPGNLRITRIDVAATHTTPQQSILAFGPLRAVRGQSHTFSEAGSSITVQYDAASGAAAGFRAEGKAMLGNAVRPNLAALAELS